MADIGTYLDCSTRHITQGTSERMTDGESGFFHTNHDYGHWVWVGEVEENDYPDDLKVVIEFAKRLGCRWINFDRDGPVCDELPEFDW